MISNNQKPVYLRLDKEYIEYLRYLSSFKSINDGPTSYIDLIKHCIFEKYPYPSGGYNPMDLLAASGILKYENMLSL